MSLVDGSPSGIVIKSKIFKKVHPNNWREDGGSRASEAGTRIPYPYFGEKLSIKALRS